jgi:hypothetical protein
MAPESEDTLPGEPEGSFTGKALAEIRSPGSLDDPKRSAPVDLFQALSIVDVYDCRSGMRLGDSREGKCIPDAAEGQLSRERNHRNQ